MSNLFDRMKLFVQRDKEFRSALYDIMGFFPHNVELYRIAFAHKSQEYRSKKTGDRPLNNERLEFLGDAVLETVVSDIVYHHFKTKREGFLTNTRSKIVSRESLGKLAKDLGIDRLIQSHTNSKAHNSFLAGNAFEAFMGAIYLDRGFDYAFRFIEHRIMGSVLDLEGVAHKEVNFKSKLLEWSQKNRIRIEFKDKQNSAASGSGNTPSFSTTVILEGLFAGDGKGFSKKEAQQNASKDALTRMRREPKFIDEIFTSKEKRTAMEADPCFVLPVIDEIEADLAREAEENAARKDRAKAERHNEKPKREPKKEQPKKEPSKTDVKKEQPKKEEPAKKERPVKKEEPAKKEEPVKKEEPFKKEEPVKEEEATKENFESIVIPISLEDIPTAEISEEAPEADITEETETLEAVAEVSTDEDTAPIEETSAEGEKNIEEENAEEAGNSSDEEKTPHAKKSRRRGRRQNAAGFTNTESIPAETSHRAEKAAKKVEEAKKEKARKIAKKTARKAAKGADDATPQQEAAQQQQTPQQQQAAAPAKAEAKPEQPAAAPAKKKPRRRKKTHADLPSETPNPEREQAISAAEEAAYQQTNTEE